MGGTHKAANGTRMLNLGQQNVRFRIHEGHVCGMVFQIADVERSLIAASQLAAAGNRVTFKAHGGDIENTKTGWIEEDARAERRHLGLAHVDRSAYSFFFSGLEGVSVASIHVLCPVRLEEQLASSSSTKWSSRSGIHARTQSP